MKDQSYYKGSTKNHLLRLERHNNGESSYTRNKVPWKIVYLEVLVQKREALIREIALKKYSHQQIEQLIGSSKNNLTGFMGRISAG